MQPSDVHALFIKPMLTCFDDPPGADPAAFFAELASELAGATEYQLAEAAKVFRRSRKARSFPTMADCIDVVFAQPKSGVGAASEPRISTIPDDDTPQRRDMADRLCIDHPWVQEAARNGWLLGLWDFCRINGRHPDGRELKRIQQVAREVESRIADIQASDGGGLDALNLNGALRRMGDAILDKREKVRRRVLGKMRRAA